LKLTTNRLTAKHKFKVGIHLLFAQTDIEGGVVIADSSKSIAMFHNKNGQFAHCVRRTSLRSAAAANR
jgi:hypothetical protein